MNWKAGDRAIVIKSENYPCMHGQQVTVLSTFINRFGEHLVEIDEPIPPGRKFSPGPVSAGIGYRSNALKLIPYDGNEKTSWEDCCWQPKELVVVG